MIAAEQGSSDIVIALIEDGADVKIVRKVKSSNWKETSLHAAVDGYTSDRKEDFIEILQQLEEKDRTLADTSRLQLETILQMKVRGGLQNRKNSGVSAGSRPHMEGQQRQDLDNVVQCCRRRRQRYSATAAHTWRVGVERLQRRLSEDGRGEKPEACSDLLASENLPTSFCR